MRGNVRAQVIVFVRGKNMFARRKSVKGLQFFKSEMEIIEFSSVIFYFIDGCQRIVAF